VFLSSDAYDIIFNTRATEMIRGRFRLNDSVRVVRLIAPGSDRGLISTIPADSVIEVKGCASLRQMVEATERREFCHFRSRPRRAH
jgi:hypothetical protein